MLKGITLMWGNKTLDQSIKEGDVKEYDVPPMVETPFDNSRSVVTIEDDSL